MGVIGRVVATIIFIALWLSACGGNGEYPFPTPTPSPTKAPWQLKWSFYLGPQQSPTPTVTPWVVTATQTETGTPTNTPTSTPTNTPTNTASATATLTVTPEPSVKEQNDNPNIVINICNGVAGSVGCGQLQLIPPTATPVPAVKISRQPSATPCTATPEALCPICPR